jgi:hypothetical protein
MEPLVQIRARLGNVDPLLVIWFVIAAVFGGWIVHEWMIRRGHRR